MIKKYSLIFILGLLFISGFVFPSFVFADEKQPYGTFTPKIGDINKAIENYDYNSKSRLTGINIDTNIPSKLYCGEQFEFWVQITGDYEDEKGNIYKRKIVNPDVLIDAPDIIMSKKYSYEGKYEYIISTPSNEGNYQINIKAKYENESSSRSYDIKTSIRPSWANKQYLGIFSGSLGIFGVEMNSGGGGITTLLDGVFNASISFRKRWTDSDPYVMGIEGGVKIFEKNINKNWYPFGGIDIGFDVYSEGLFGMSYSESKLYVAPNIGILFVFDHLSCFAETRSYIYEDRTLGLIKIGLGFH